MESTSKQSNSISVVVPVYGSETSLHRFVERCRLHLDSIVSDWEIILVVDASPDASWSVACQLNAIDNRVKCVQLSRNHGQQHATLIGLSYASKDYVITLDDDLQCWPEDIVAFIKQLNSGIHLVIGQIPIKEKKHHWFRNISSCLNTILIGKVLNKPKGLSLSSFRGMTLNIAQKLASYDGPHPHITAMLLKTVPKQMIANVIIRHSSRADGLSSTYTFRKLLKTISFLIINHSYIPLRVMIFWGFSISFLSIMFALWVVVKVFFINQAVPGWASLAVLVSFLSGNILMALGVLGEYIGRLVEQNSHVSKLSVFEERL